MLNREVERVRGDKEEDRKKEKINKPERCWASWLPGILIYTGTIVKAYPSRAFALIQYIDIIYRAYIDFPGHVWLLYDQGFCMTAAIHPEMRCVTSSAEDPEPEGLTTAEGNAE